MSSFSFGEGLKLLLTAFYLSRQESNISNQNGYNDAHV